MIPYALTEAQEAIERADWYEYEDMPWTPKPIDILRGSCECHRDPNNDRGEGVDCRAEARRKHREALVARSIARYCARFNIEDIKGFRAFHCL